MKRRSGTAGTTGKKKVLLVDDHPVMREGLAVLINLQTDLMVCGEAESAAQALASVGEKKPDIVLVDISLEGRGGLDLIKDLHAQSPRLPTLVLSMHDEGLYAERALRAGARGYIMKRQSSQNLLEGIRRVLNGQYYFSERISAQMLDLAARGRSQATPTPIELLSNRELEVFQMIGRGQNTREVARKLNLSIKTIASHRENLKRKLQLSNAAELVRNAIHWAKEHQIE